MAENGEVQPNLASSWEVSDNGLVYTFKLTDAAQFHDGSAFDAKGCCFFLQSSDGRGQRENPRRASSNRLRVSQRWTRALFRSRSRTKKRFSCSTWARAIAAIVASETAETNNATPVGTGPFKFDSWTRGDRLTLVKNPDHRDADSVALDKVTFRFISDPAAATAAMMAEELDAFPGFPAPELLEQFEADPRFRVNQGNTEGEVILAMNNAKPPFDNIEVRRAISTAIDREEIIDGAIMAKLRPSAVSIPPTARPMWT